MPEIVFKGKEYVYNHHLTVPYRPLEPQATKGIGAADLNGNLVIHGDNLHALKSLLPRHAGQVDLIFIDPPYNTGNEGWCYSDGVNSPIMKEWLSTNPVDGEDMLRHDKWLCMMWPRLVLLRELLSERGSIWITLDDNEVHRARMALDEIFGDGCFVATMVWQKRYSRENREAIGDAHDYVLVYAKSVDQFKRVRNLVAPTESQLAVYKNPNNDPKGRWRGVPMTAQGTRKNQQYVVVAPDGTAHRPPEGRCWSMVESEYLRLRSEGRIWFGAEGNSQPSVIRYMNEIDGFVPWTWWPNDEVGHTDEAKKEMHELFGRTDVFDTPKPLRLMDRIVQIGSSTDSIILDSFAGSGTTAHAVLKANAKDGGSRRFILVEGEDYADTLTAERVRRVINGYAWEGTQRESLLEEKITLTQFKKAAEWLARVDAIKRVEGLGGEAEGTADLVEQAARKMRKRKRFDKIEARIDDGVLRVEGVRRISERAPGLGGSFTYCTLGEAVDLDKLLSGEKLPAFDALGAWLFYTATGGVLPPPPKKAPMWYLGEAKDSHVWLVYKPELHFLKSPEAALTLSLARQVQDWGKSHDAKRKRTPLRHLVFAPAKYLSNRQLQEHGVDYAPLPFALYREA
ncbi:MAG: site-specific DNA-methyltransferase [Rhodoferax sp.]|nr:site-specific DNA-methyltransferase [Rhodoferax sp.]